MFEFEVKYKGRNVKATGPNRLAVQYEKDVIPALKLQLVDTAVQFLDDEQKSGEFPKKDFLKLVDGSLEKRLIDVKPFGQITFKTKLEDLRPVLLQTVQAIAERSPERRGAYANNNVLFRNNVFVAKGFSNMIDYITRIDDFKPNDIFRFINVSPYARKLEALRVTKFTTGKNKGLNRGSNRVEREVKGNLVTVPAGTYVLSARAISRKFKELKKNVRFSYIPISPSTVRQLDTSGKDTTGYVFSPNTNKKGKAGRPYLYPSLTITANKETVGFNRGFTEDAGL